MCVKTCKDIAKIYCNREGEYYLPIYPSVCLPVSVSASVSVYLPIWITIYIITVFHRYYSTNYRGVRQISPQPNSRNYVKYKQGSETKLLRHFGSTELCGPMWFYALPAAEHVKLPVCSRLFTIVHVLRIWPSHFPFLLSWHCKGCHKHEPTDTPASSKSTEIKL